MSILGHGVGGDMDLITTGAITMAAIITVVGIMAAGITIGIEINGKRSGERPKTYCPYARFVC